MPPPLELDDPDAGVSSPPVILDSVSPEEFRFPGPVVVKRMMEDRSFTLTLLDLDVDDVLSVRMFVDYSPEQATSFSSDCVAPNNGTPTRQATCPAASLCGTVTDTATHALEAVVADREFLTLGDPAGEGQPPFRAVAPGGSPAVVRSWLLQCED